MAQTMKSAQFLVQRGGFGCVVRVRVLALFDLVQHLESKRLGAKSPPVGLQFGVAMRAHRQLEAVAVHRTLQVHGTAHEDALGYGVVDRIDTDSDE